MASQWEHVRWNTLPEGTVWIKGQLERGGDTGYLHWQICFATAKKESLAGVRKIFEGFGSAPGHYELTRSDAATAYVHKDETAVEDTRFELGDRPHKRNDKQDWDHVWKSACEGNLGDLPSSLRVLHYRTLRAIREDHLQPTAMVRTAVVYHGRTGTGKSRRAFDEAGPLCYVKDSRTKWWNGYRGITVLT